MLCFLSGCKYEKVFPPTVPTMSNTAAIDRALRLNSLTEGEEPFHLLLEIDPPKQNGALLNAAEMRAEVELFWMNASTYRVVIRSQGFSQIKIVNGRVVEEHDVGDFYPRWIQNFVDALLDPVPQLTALRNTTGEVPVGAASHACISHPEQASGYSRGNDSRANLLC